MHCFNNFYPFTLVTVANFLSKFHDQIFFEKIVPDDCKLFISNSYAYSCGGEAVAMAADDAWIQAKCESCGRLCSNESFYHRGPHISHVL